MATLQPPTTRQGAICAGDVGPLRAWQTMRRRMRGATQAATVLPHYGFPFHTGPTRTPVDRLRALARRQRFPRRTRPAHIVARAAMTLGWPFGAAVAAYRACADMRSAGLRSGRATWLDMMALALARSIPPVEYAAYRLDLADNRRHADDYVFWIDQPGLAAINRQRGADGDDVRDKHRFAEICARHALPHVPTLATFAGGRQIWPAAAFIPDAPALFVKALAGAGGAGATRWMRDGRAYVDGDGRRVSAEDLPALWRQSDCIVQPCVRAHADIEALGNGALAALRIVTGLDGQGEPHVVTSALILPAGNRVTSQGGIFCGLDLTSGAITKAMHVAGGAAPHHPDTGRPLIGATVPFWRESLDLARRAHAMAFARFAFLGWDVVVTAHGPLLLEANAGWGTMHHQMLDGPLGQSPVFDQLLSHHV